MSSRWYGAPGEYAMRKGCMSTVGVLVYLDGSRPFRSWDGDMVRALVCFSVDGRLVRVATGPAPQAAAAAAPSVTVPGVGGTFPQQQQHQRSPVVYGPPPSPMPTLQPPVDPQPLVLEADTPTTASTLGGGRGGGGDAGEGPGGASQQQHEGEEDLLSPPPSPWSPPQEEMAPWEIAAAEATSARGVEGGGAVTFGRGPAVAGPGARASATGVGGGTPAVAASAVPEISAALGLALPKDRDLFPTVTIHSSNTEVRAFVQYGFSICCCGGLEEGCFAVNDTRIVCPFALCERGEGS